MTAKDDRRVTYGIKRFPAARKEGRKVQVSIQLRWPPDATLEDVQGALADLYKNTLTDLPNEYAEAGWDVR